MICLIDTRSRLSIATLVFYTCIWFPIKQMKQKVLDILSSVISVFLQPIKGNDDLINESMDPLVVHFPAANFNETTMHREENGGEGDCSAADASCSICLAEYESEDMVVRLPRCGHVFHRDCIKKWLDRNQFTCPLCRDLLLHVNTFPCNEKRRGFH